MPSSLWGGFRNSNVLPILETLPFRGLMLTSENYNTVYLIQDVIDVILFIYVYFCE